MCCPPHPALSPGVPGARVGTAQPALSSGASTPLAPRLSPSYNASAMQSLYRFQAPPSPCGYLPEEVWRLEYECVGKVTPAEYLERMLQGWRRFGDMFFHPRCPTCTACRSVRVCVESFRPSR